jgi:hypothetical protein
MNKIYFNTIFRFFQSPFFPSAYKYIRYYASYTLNFLRFLEKVSGFIIREYVFFIKIVVAVMAAVVVLPVGLEARFLFFDVDMVTYSVVYYSVMRTFKVLRYLLIR